MSQSAGRNVFTQPLPPLPSFDETQREQPTIIVNQVIAALSILTFIEGIFYLALLGTFSYIPGARQSLGMGGLVLLLLGILGFQIVLMLPILPWSMILFLRFQK